MHSLVPGEPGNEATTCNSCYYVIVLQSQNQTLALCQGLVPRLDCTFLCSAGIREPINFNLA